MNETIKVVLWAEHCSTAGISVAYMCYDEPHDDDDSDVIIIEGDALELLETASRYRNRKNTFGRTVCKSILNALEYERLIVPAELYEGWLYYDDEDSFRPVCSGGVDTGLTFNGYRVFRAGGVVTDEGEAAELPIDASLEDVEVCWVMP